MIRNRLTLLVAAVLVLALGACHLFDDGGGGGSPSPGRVRACADVTNGTPGSAPSKLCGPRSASLQLIRTAHAADTLLDAGTVTRAQLISVTGQVANLTPSPFSGYIEAVFDAGCNGAATWPVLPKQGVQVPAEQTVSLTAGGQCGDMPVGSRTLTATAYAADGETVVDRVVVTFNLIE